MGKYLFLSNSGDSLGLAFKFKDAGHQVGVYVRESRARKNFDRMLLRFNTGDQWRAWLDKNTTVIFDSCGGGVVADQLRMQGFIVIGGSKFADILSGDHDTAMEYFRLA